MESCSHLTSAVSGWRTARRCTAAVILSSIPAGARVDDGGRGAEPDPGLADSVSRDLGCASGSGPALSSASSLGAAVLAPPSAGTRRRAGALIAALGAVGSRASARFAGAVSAVRRCDGAAALGSHAASGSAILADPVPAGVEVLPVPGAPIAGPGAAFRPALNTAVACAGRSGPAMGAGRLPATAAGAGALFDRAFRPAGLGNRRCPRQSERAAP